MATCVLCILLVLQVVSGSEQYHRREGFMDHLNSGIKLAQNLLGSESVALKVADFVVRAFNTVSPTSGTSAGDRRRPAGPLAEDPRPDDRYSGEKQPGPGPGPHEASPWPHLVRLLGLQPSQLSAVAVNALVFVAQMLVRNLYDHLVWSSKLFDTHHHHEGQIPHPRSIYNCGQFEITSFLAGPRRPARPCRSDDPAHWILHKDSKKLQDIIAMAKNESLTDLVEELVTDYGTREETGCIRLLVCKITPFVSRMQDAVFRKKEGNSSNKDVRGAAVLYRHLPTNEEIQERSDACQKRFPDCQLNE